MLIVYRLWYYAKYLVSILYLFAIYIKKGVEINRNKAKTSKNEAKISKTKAKNNKDKAGISKKEAKK